MMYIGADWETVNGIKGSYTAINVPNLGSFQYSQMHIYVLSLTVVQNDLDTSSALAIHYCSLVDSRCRDFIHCKREVSL
jgi:hypothetical protein